jgi:two-component system OmpR family response regulator
MLEALQTDRPDLDSDHILIVTGDRSGGESLAAYLKKNGCRASTLAGSQQMRFALEDGGIDLIVLCAQLPDEDPLSLCRDLQSGQWRAVPVLMLTAQDDETERILGLEMGADDVVTEPVSPRELLARIRAVLRRTRMPPPPGRQPSARHEAAPPLHFGDWRLDTTTRQLLGACGEAMTLSVAEYRLLRVFLDHPQRVLTRDQLQNLTSGHDAEVFDRSIDLLVSRLRQRLSDDAREPRYIRTLRNVGYIFSADLQTTAPDRRFPERRPAA